VVSIENFSEHEYLEWLDCHASIMVDSYAWWTVLHKRPRYKNEIIDLVAKVEGKIVGFVTAELNSKVIDIVKDDYGFVWEFGVHRNYRENGIGFKLINELHNSMRNNFGINKSIWYSQDTNAQAFYKKIGMTEIERHWQFTVNPTVQLNHYFKKEHIECLEIRGNCSVEDFDTIASKYKFSNDDALMPQLCIGYEYTR